MVQDQDVFAYSSTRVHEFRIDFKKSPEMWLPCFLDRRQWTEG